MAQQETQEDAYTTDLAERLQKLPPQVKARALRALREKKARELEELLERKQQELKFVEQDASESEEELLGADEHAKEELERLLSQAQDQEGQTTKNLSSMIPDSLYSFTNPGVYRELRSIADNVRERGYARPGEQARLEELEQQTQSLQQSYRSEQLYQADAQRNNYFSRTSDLLKQLHDDLHNLDTLNKRGDSSGSLYKL